jgi:hypothetical protein
MMIIRLELDSLWDEKNVVRNMRGIVSGVLWDLQNFSLDTTHTYPPTTFLLAIELPTLLCITCDICVLYRLVRLATGAVVIFLSKPHFSINKSSASVV